MLRIFKNKLFLLVLVTVSLLIIMGVSSKPNSKLHIIGDAVSVPLSPVQEFFTYIGHKVEGVSTFLKDTKALDSENKDLKKKIDELENDKRNLLRYEEENKELREALNLKNQFNDYTSIGGNITAKDVGNWFNIFTIDRGANDGVTVDSPVVTSKGLVGSIVDTSPFSSKVMSIIDVDSVVTAVISSKSTDILRVKGDLSLKDKGLCRLDYIPIEMDIEVGDTVETSGIGGIYPRGILIGTVKQVVQTSNELNRYAIIEPAVDFRKLQEVFVLQSKNKNTETGSAKK